MALETFTWRLQNGDSPEISYRVIDTQFGDGYTQSYADGINTKSETYPITWTGQKDKAKEVMAFFDRHAGWKRFFWTPPLGEIGLFTCSDPVPVNIGGDKYTITATFVKRFGA